MSPDPGGVPCTWWVIVLVSPCAVINGGLIQHKFAILQFRGGSVGKESACNAGDMDLITGCGRFLGGGPSNPFQYSCLENPMDRGAWWAIVRGVAKSQTLLKQLSTHPCTV